MTARLIVATLLLVGAQGGDDAPLSLADLAAEHEAVTGRSHPGEPPTAVKFRALWDDPDAWRGRRVTVKGRVARVFSQPALGSFPPLVEAWIEEPPGNLFCAVFSPAEAAPPVAAGESVAFTGTFLRRIRYAADDGARLAPLIVGAEPPRVEPKRPGSADFDLRAPDSVWPESTWAVGLIIGVAGIGAYLAWRSWDQPARVGRKGRPADFEPEPEFLDQEPEPVDGEIR
jgi:hypothetical protein